MSSLCAAGVINAVMQERFSRNVTRCRSSSGLKAANLCVLELLREGSPGRAFGETFLTKSLKLVIT